MIKTQHDTTQNTWFITFTCFQWIPLFQITDSYHLIYNWFNMLSERYDMKIHGFVIMPNHVHIILYLPDTIKKLNLVVANGKRFIAYGLIEHLKANNYESMPIRLFSACTEKELAKGQKHKVFEPSFDAQP